MSHQPVIHLGVEQSGRSVSAEMVRARLSGVDVQRPKRIDRQIDYFGTAGARRTVVGETSLDVALSRFLHVILHAVKGTHGGRRPVIGL